MFLTDALYFICIDTHIGMTDIKLLTNIFKLIPEYRSSWACVFGISNFRNHPLLTTPFVNCSDESGQDPSWVGLPHSPATAQITLSSAMLRSSLCVVGCFCAYEMRLTFNHSRHLKLPTCVYVSSKINFRAFMPSEVILHFCYSDSISSSNKLGALHL